MDFDSLSEDRKKQLGFEYAKCLSPRLLGVLYCLRDSKFPIDLRTKLVPVNDWELEKTGAVALTPVKPKWFGKLVDRGYASGTYKEARVTRLGEYVLQGAGAGDPPLDTRPWCLIEREVQEVVVYKSETTSDLPK